MTKRHFLVLPLLLGGVLAGNLSAAPIFGTFQVGGAFRVTLTTINWSSTNPILPEAFNIDEGTGSFAVLPDGSLHTINNLNNTDHPVGTFADYEFIVFNDPTLPSLLLNTIFPGNGGSAGCSEAPRVNPIQTCTPPIPGGSPFTLTNLQGGGGRFNSTATFSMAGVTSDGLSEWSGIVTGSFVSQSFQSVLNDLETQGFVNATISGDFIVTVTPIPEPGTFALIGMGLIMATVAAKRFKKKS